MNKTTNKYSSVITGTLCLCTAGIISRILGFFYKLWLGNLIGPKGIGIYQLVFPIFSIGLSLCGGAFQTTISKFTAQYIERDKISALKYLKLCVWVAFSTACTIAVFFTIFKHETASYFLLNNDCSVFIPYVALAIPFSALHNCLSGWYYGQKKTIIPAFSNILEELARIIFIFILIKFFRNITVLEIVFALSAGEITAATFMCISLTVSLKKQFHNTNITVNYKLKQYFYNILKMVWPLSANRFIMNILQSVEAVMIPNRLMLYGYSEHDALSIYGTLSGMAFSFILFPTALISSFSLMLIPEISKSYSKGNILYVKKLSCISLICSFAIGLLCTFLFHIFGITIGNICFPNTQTGEFLQCLSLVCPFMYMNFIISSILHGMGHTTITFRTQIIALILRLSITIFLIPIYGISCYFISLLLSQILTSILNIYSFNKLLKN